MKRLFALVLSFCMALSIGVCAAAAETPLRENETACYYLLLIMRSVEIFF